MRNGIVLPRSLLSKLVISLQPSRHLSTFAIGDRVLAHSLKRTRSEGFLSKPLTLNGTTSCHGTEISHADVIGKPASSTLVTKNGTIMRLLEPTLAEYVCLTRRLVTPIYPSNTNILTSLLDINAPKSGSEDEIHILEAGTGHGSLTLHLARAIHGCNPAYPVNGTNEEKETWKKNRVAVLHTLDISEKHSKHAAEIVSGFRRGVYAPHVDFHVGDVPDFLTEAATKQKDKKFLTHVVLDMPNAEQRLPAVVEHLRDDGILLIFNPSVTQITECVEKIADGKLPLWLETVWELSGGVSGGREWDVKLVKTKKPPKTITKSIDTEKERVLSDTGSDDAEPSSEKRIGLWSWISGLFASPKPAEVEAKEVETVQKSVMVCRPKAGHQIPVGGFVGVFTKKVSVSQVTAVGSSENGRKVLE